MSRRRIIINILDDSIDDLMAINRVQQVISGGKISGDGKSYCYGTVWVCEEVFTDKPRKNSPNTYTFYVKSKSTQEVKE